jgi:putative tricarboxylic transport membrane protein
MIMIKTLVTASRAKAPLIALFAAMASPASATECIAPSDPGGGWDFTCRTVGRILTELDLVDGTVQVTNMAGGTGAVAFAHVASDRADDEDLLVATSTIGITQLAQGKYPGEVDAMRYVAMLGADIGIIAVAADSPWQNLDDLMAAIEEDPSSVIGGGEGPGSWDHIRYLMLAQAAGIEDLASLRWVQFDGGTAAITQMLGGQIDLVSTDVGEAAGFVESGDIRLLAVLSDEPVPAFPDAPTAISQGYDVTGYNWRGFYVGNEVSDAAYEEWVSKLETVYNSPEWQEAAAASGLIPIWRGGAEFTDYVMEEEAEMEEISRQIGIIQCLSG